MQHIQKISIAVIIIITTPADDEDRIIRRFEDP